MSTPLLLVVGGGQMGAALVGGMVSGGAEPSGIVVVESSGRRRGELGEIPALSGVAVVGEVAMVVELAAPGGHPSLSGRVAGRDGGVDALIA
ncbi:MAG: hypothetical protein ACRD0J_01505, partial [Acidimicrobiales bacterium]